MFKLKNVVILLVVLFLLLSIGVQVQASDLTLDLTNLSTTNTANTADDTNTVANEDVTLNVATNEEETQVVQPSANRANTADTSAENDLPQTGVTEDITVMFFIIVCAIFAIYAYKKIRDYRS